MDLECKYGLMVLVMKENGEIIKPMGRVNFGMPMEIYTKVNGQTTKLTDMEFTYTLMVQNMKDSGKMIYKMGME